jgi:hypothetical protein
MSNKSKASYEVKMGKGGAGFKGAAGRVRWPQKRNSRDQEAAAAQMRFDSAQKSLGI